MNGTTFLRNFCDAFDSAYDYDSYQDGEYQAEQPSLASEKTVFSASDVDELHVCLVGLKHVSCAKAAEDDGNGEENGEHFAERRFPKFSQPFFQRVHRTA